MTVRARAPQGPGEPGHPIHSWEIREPRWTRNRRAAAEAQGRSLRLGAQPTCGGSRRDVMDGAVSIRRLAVAMCTLTACLLLVGCGARNRRGPVRAGTTDSVGNPSRTPARWSRSTTSVWAPVADQGPRGRASARYRDGDNELRNEQVEGLAVIRPGSTATERWAKPAKQRVVLAAMRQHWWFDLEKDPVRDRRRAERPTAKQRRVLV